MKTPTLLVAALTALLAGALATLAQDEIRPTLVSVVPTNAASGVSPTAPVVFTFSEAMNTDLSTALFIGMSGPITSLTASWSPNERVLTYTPTTPLPANALILWSLAAEDPAGNFLEGEASGLFITGNSGGGGSGTNANTRFSVGKTHIYNQTSTAAPALDPEMPYNFQASTSLTSNRTASSITLTLPTAAVTNLTANMLAPEIYFYFDERDTLAAFDEAFPSGNYVFFVEAPASNQSVTVSLSASMQQPGVPHIANYVAAQSVDPAQPFTLQWDAFSGGTAADYIQVGLAGAFATPHPGQPDALTGTATSVLIPAGILQSGQDYVGSITFQRMTMVTNDPANVKVAYRATATLFNLHTGGGSTPAGNLVLTNCGYSAENEFSEFSAEVLCPPDQDVMIEYSPTMAPDDWWELLTTSSPDGRIPFTHTTFSYEPCMFYRAQKVAP